MEIYVTYRPIITRKIEVDDKYRPLLIHKTWNEQTLEEMEKQSDLIDELINEIKNEKLLDCDEDIYSIDGPNHEYLYEG